jgi:hypothetical protein
MMRNRRWSLPLGDVVQAEADRGNESLGLRGSRGGDGHRLGLREPWEYDVTE